MEFLTNLYLLSLDTAPLLVFGLLLAGMMKIWLPENFLQQQLGQPGLGGILKAALLGAPMPLCSCSVLPVAMGLRRAGASRGATVSFLVSTPETGLDSISLSYGLLGPVMTLVRPLAAIVSAIVAGLMAGWQGATLTAAPAATPCASQTCATGAIAASPCSAPAGDKPNSSCCDAPKQAGDTWRNSLYYSFGQLLDDILPWLLVGLVIAAAIQTFIPEQCLAEWGQGPFAMIIMVLIGVPMYICASASTPVAAGLLLAGVSPGTVLVFLLAGPATNMATIAIIHRELGRRAVISYLGSVIAVSIGAGLLLDTLIVTYDWPVVPAIGEGAMLTPLWLALASLLLLAIAGIKPLRKASLGRWLLAH